MLANIMCIAHAKVQHATVFLASLILVEKPVSPMSQSIGALHLQFCDDFWCSVSKKPFKFLTLTVFKVRSVLTMRRLAQSNLWTYGRKRTKKILRGEK